MLSESQTNRPHSLGNGDIGLSHQPYSPEKIEKARKAGKYLQLLIHSQECKGVDCPNAAMCRNLKLLLNHCVNCKSMNPCPISGCQQTKTLLHHLTICRWERKNARLYGTPIKECMICHFMNGDDESTKSQSGVDTDGFPVPQPPKRFRSASEEYADRMGFMRHRGTVCRSRSVTDACSCSMYSVREEGEEDGPERPNSSCGRLRSVSTSNVGDHIDSGSNSSSDSSDSFLHSPRVDVEDAVDAGPGPLLECRERSASAATFRPTFSMHSNQEGSSPCQSAVPMGGAEGFRNRGRSVSACAGRGM